MNSIVNHDSSRTSNLVKSSRSWISPINILFRSVPLEFNLHEVHPGVAIQPNLELKTRPKLDLQISLPNVTEHFGQ